VVASSAAVDDSFVVVADAVALVAADAI